MIMKLICSNDMDDNNKHLEECNPNRKRKIFEDMIIDILSNKKT